MKYNGTINASGSQTELYNVKGNMTVGGTIATTGDGKVVILNKGDGMTVNGTISSATDVKVVNKGSQKATVDESKITAPNEKKFYEQLKKSSL